MNNPQKVLSSLKVTGNLPSMPQVLVQLLDSCQNPEVQVQTIAGIVDKDAAISAKVLQLVNSAFIGVRKAIRSIEQAVVYLGMDTVRNLAISISVQQVFRRVETNGLLSIDRFWYHSYTNGLLSRNIALTVHYPDPSEAYLAGLLHDIGKLLLWMAFPGSYAPLLLKGIRCHDARLAFLEEEKLHVNHCQAGAWLCEQWRLPSLIADAIRFHHHPIDEVRRALPLTKIICFSDLLSHNEPDTPECLRAAEQLFGMERKSVAGLVSGLDEEVEQLAEQLGIHIPRLAKTSHDKDPESEETHRETSLGLISRIRDISQLNGLLDNLLRAENREQVIVAVEQSLKILFNEEHCLLMLAEGHSGRMVAMASKDNALGRETQGFFFIPEEHPDSLPHQAIRRRRLCHTFQDKTKKQPSSNLFDTQLLHLFDCQGLAVLPMICHDRLEGLLLIGLTANSFRSLGGQTGALQLVASHAAVTLQLDRIRRQQAEQIAAERLQAATLVARKIGHELNNPLAILRNYLHILERKVSQGHEVREEIVVLDGELERLGRITRGLEDLSREHKPPCPQRIDLHQLLQTILAPFQIAQDPDSQVTITLAPTDSPLLVELDPDHLHQILHNLVDNALDALQSQGSVTIRTEAKNNQVFVHVEDNGPGIDPASINDIFNAGASTKNGSHRGLGLSIAGALAQQMHGSLTCTSAAGKTIFTLAMPA
jgi:HD-like signal output (HDOD) protein/signal transduction histidine kinase